MRKKKMAARLEFLFERLEAHKLETHARLAEFQDQITALENHHIALHGRLVRMEDAVVELLERVTELEPPARGSLGPLTNAHVNLSAPGDI